MDKETIRPSQQDEVQFEPESTQEFEQQLIAELERSSNLQLAATDQREIILGVKNLEELDEASLFQQRDYQLSSLFNAAGLGQYSCQAPPTGNSSSALYLSSATAGVGGLAAVGVVGEEDVKNTQSSFGGEKEGQIVEDSGSQFSGRVTSLDPDGMSNQFEPQYKTPGQFGVFSIDRTGNWQYELENTNPQVDALNQGETLIDSLAVQAVDGSSTTLSILISGVDDPAVAIADAASGDEDTLIVVSNVLANDHDPDSSISEASIITFTSASRGVVVNNGDGSFSYMPEENFYGSDSFSYTIADSNGNQSSAVVNLFVNPVNDAPIIILPSDSVSILKGESVDIPGIQVIDPDIVSSNPTNEPSQSSRNEPLVQRDESLSDDELLIRLSVSHGVLFTDDSTEGKRALEFRGTVDELNTVLSALKYEPDEGFEGTDNLVIDATDNGGDGPPTHTLATLPLIVQDFRAVDDAASGREDERIDIQNVLLNDISPGDELTAENIVDFTQAEHGFVASKGDGGFVYIPDSNFNGEDDFSYTIDNGAGRQSTGTVFVTVIDVPEEEAKTEPDHESVSEVSETTAWEQSTSNQAPVNTVPSSPHGFLSAFSQNAINNLSVSDQDIGTGSITVTLKVDHGYLSFSTTPTGSSLSIDSSQSELKIIGQLIDVNNALNLIQYGVDQSTPGTLVNSDPSYYKTNFTMTSSDAVLSDMDIVEFHIQTFGG